MISKISLLIQNSKAKMRKYKLKFKTFYFLIAFLSFAFLLLTLRGNALAGPSSGSYQLLDYGFGSGAVATSSSNNFMLQGIAGEIETASLSSTNFRIGPGLTYTLQPNVPPAPDFTNPANYYNKLKLVVNTGGNSTDTTYAIAISTDGFVSNITYVQADNTLGSSIFFQNYTSWGGASGVTIIGLDTGTTYSARVAAKRGTFTQGAFGPTATAATINPTFTFSLQTTSQSVPPFSVNIGQLNAGAVTTSADKITATISTNANNGGLVYLYGTNAGLKSTTAGNYNIGSVSNDLNSILEGYGARGTSVTQVSGGPMELISPYNGAGNNVGVIDTAKRPLSDSTSQPVVNGQTSFELQAKAKNTTPSATDYTDTLTVIATGSF
ncbi:MAG: hypothetical protein M1444_01425 [Patescibacteria group bacterium]|nr:hypothetical protein [Patescibacteria group bacterium]